MKKFVLLMVAVLTVTTLIGCNKKSSEETDSMTNGVMSENVVSVTDATAGVPIVIDNAEALPQTTGEMVTGAPVSTKPTAKEIQQALKNAGFYTGSVDGNIGPKTKKAIEEFQAQNGLKADGKVGPKTWRALSAHLGQSSEVANPMTDAQTIGQ
jgi:peptidoglycan hydrolase-like protein with peptidoglycan-binding domain